MGLYDTNEDCSRVEAHFTQQARSERDKALAELSALRARVGELEAMQKALHLGIANDAGIIRELRERLATLEAPPVVPEGWTVQPVCGWWTYSAKGPASEHTFDKAHFPAVLRALAWAIENDARPPHAADVKGGG